ncbi:MAG: calcineurin-like phosphoesterase C-terminal domain-containing protein [Longimicrobiales bacterium]
MNVGFGHLRSTSGCRLPDVQETVRSLGGDMFGVACGDIMFDDLSLYPEYERAVAAMGVPFFQIVGNHDLDFDGRSDQTSTRTFQRHFGPEHYSFDRGAVHYIVLDDVFWHGAGYLGYLRADVLGWLENDLAHVEAGRTVVMFLHIPVLGSQHVRRDERNPAPGVSVMNREALYRPLEPYNAHLLTGHTHESEHLFEHGVHEHVHGTVCGAWWSGPICHDGTPNGYSVYEISGDSVTWRYKSTGLPASQQMRIYGHGADPAAPDEIVANVWDWDPDWRVVWYEAGERRGAMAPRTGRDPLSVELHAGPDLPSRRTWVEPMPTAHLFYAPASREAADIVIEATDRFGRTRTARLEPT